VETNIRERAARAMHRNCPADETARIVGLDSALRQSVDMGQRHGCGLAAARALRRSGNQAYLESRLTNKSRAVKLDS